MQSFQFQLQMHLEYREKQELPFFLHIQHSMQDSENLWGFFLCAKGSSTFFHRSINVLNVSFVYNQTTLQFNFFISHNQTNISQQTSTKDFVRTFHCSRTFCSDCFHNHTIKQQKKAEHILVSLMNGFFFNSLSIKCLNRQKYQVLLPLGINGLRQI